MLEECKYGAMAEWLIAAVLKTAGQETAPWVQILLAPLLSFCSPMQRRLVQSQFMCGCKSCQKDPFLP